jgi:diphosphomevalonate decarboxylase
VIKKLHKATAVSPANIAFIKYWGRSDNKLFIPRNNNISMNLSGCKTTTTVELRDDLKKDFIEVKFFGQDSYTKLEQKDIKQKNLYGQVERIRKEAGINKKVHLRSVNNFPSDAGIASSASSFSAATAALLVAFELEDKYEDKVELSRQIRLCGSSSAIRSCYGGFVELIAGKSHEDTYAVQLAGENYWDLVDIVAIVSPEKKLVSSSEGHVLANTSPYFETRIIEMQDRIKKVRQYIMDKNLKELGPLIEEESTSLHLIMMTSVPPIYYWGPGSIRIMQDCMRWRIEDGLFSYFTLDAGPNVHVICEKKNAEEVQRRLSNNEFVKWTIYNEPCEGTKLVNDHLF